MSKFFINKFAYGKSAARIQHDTLRVGGACDDWILPAGHSFVDFVSQSLHSAVSPRLFEPSVYYRWLGSVIHVGVAMLRTTIVSILNSLAVVPRIERVDPGYGTIARVVRSPKPIFMRLSGRKTQMVSHIHLMVKRAVVIGHVFFQIQASVGMERGALVLRRSDQPRSNSLR